MRSESRLPTVRPKSRADRDVLEPARRWTDGQGCYYVRWWPRVAAVQLLDLLCDLPERSGLPTIRDHRATNSRDVAIMTGNNAAPVLGRRTGET